MQSTATEANPPLLISRIFRPGWVRIRLKATAATPGWLELRAVADGAELRLRRVEMQGTADLDCLEYIAHPVRAFRLYPPGGPGSFRLERLRIERQSTPRALAHALAAKARLLRKYWHTGAALRRGFSLLLRGEFKQLWRKVFRGVNGPDLEGRESYDADRAYDAWRRGRALTEADRDRLRREAAALIDLPVFSILMHAAGGREADLRRSVESLRRQTYPAWELCIVGADDSTALSNIIGDDNRIRIAYTSNGGAVDYVALMDAGDEWAEHALGKLAQAAVADRDAAMLYADEDWLAPDGRHVEPYFKPDWSPELLLSWMYAGRPVVFRADLVRQFGGCRPELGAAQEHELALRIAADGGRAAHVPDVLYHRAGPLEAPDGEAARAVLRRHLERVGREGVVETGPVPGLHRVRCRVRGAPRVSIVIGSACRPVRIRGERTFYLRKCLESIGRGTWREHEIIVLHGPAVPAELGRMLEQFGAVRAAYAAPFSWARAMNQGAALTRGEHLLFLNDDVEVITPDWLERLLEFSQQPEIGAVGAKLFFPGGQIQHAGVAILGGRPLHPFYAHRGDHPGYFNSLLAPRNCSAVTGACLMTRADVFRSVGGFDEGFPLNYNDVDYCLRLIAGGRRVVCTPHARLYHHELGTRRAGVRPAEMDAFRRRWGAAWAEDPFHNPNLSVDHLDCRIRASSGA